MGLVCQTHGVVSCNHAVDGPLSFWQTLGYLNATRMQWASPRVLRFSSLHKRWMKEKYEVSAKCSEESLGPQLMCHGAEGIIDPFW